MLRILSLFICLGVMSTVGAQPPQQNHNPAPVILTEPTEEPAEEPADDESLYEDMPDVMPEFEGGDVLVFHRWVMMQICYPQEAMENGIQGNVLVDFVVGRDGKVTVVDISRSPDPSLTAEVRRVFAAAPEWTPGMKDGKPVQVLFTLPVAFRLQ